MAVREDFIISLATYKDPLTAIIARPSGLSMSMRGDRELSFPAGRVAIRFLVCVPASRTDRRRRRTPRLAIRYDAGGRPADDGEAALVQPADEDGPVTGDATTVHGVLALDRLPVVPAEAMVAAGQEALAALPAHLGGSGYDVLGLPVLREAVARRLSADGLATHPDEVMITCGGQHAHALVVRAAKPVARQRSPR